MARIKFEKKELPKLPIDKLLSLKNVFLKQQWEIDEGRANSRFTKYINLLNNLQNDEQGLILELSERFTVIEQNNYLNEIITAINNLITAFPEVKQYYVLPVLAREDIGTTEVKSSHTISYLFKGDQIETKIDIEGRNFRVVKDINNFKSRTTAFKTHEKILFVDDFIGSGETAKEAVEILDGMDVKTSEIAFLSIVAHKTGVERLEMDSYKVFFSRLATRGISDFYLVEYLMEYLTLSAQEVGKFVNSVFMFLFRFIYSILRVVFSPKFINSKITQSRMAPIFIVPTLHPSKYFISEFFGTHQAKTIYNFSF